MIRGLGRVEDTLLLVSADVALSQDESAWQACACARSSSCPILDSLLSVRESVHWMGRKWEYSKEERNRLLLNERE